MRNLWSSSDIHFVEKKTHKKKQIRCAAAKYTRVRNVRHTHAFGSVCPRCALRNIAYVKRNRKRSNKMAWSTPLVHTHTHTRTHSPCLLVYVCVCASYCMPMCGHKVKILALLWATYHCAIASTRTADRVEIEIERAQRHTRTHAHCAHVLTFMDARTVHIHMCAIEYI